MIRKAIRLPLFSNYLITYIEHLEKKTYKRLLGTSLVSVDIKDTESMVNT